jgi:hypothetical protein
MEFKIPKLTRKDWLGIALLVIVVVLLAIPTYYRPNTDCEVARPAYKCESAFNVMKEHCAYWGEFKCNTAADNSLPQVEWYLKSLCDIHNADHANKLDCTNLKHACNQVSEGVCPLA